MDFCTRAARALGVPVDDVLVLAGLKAPPPAPVAEETVAVAALRTMTDAERKIALKMLQALGNAPTAHGVNEHLPGYGINRDVAEFYEVAEQLARLPEGAIRDEAMAAIRAIAESAEKRALASAQPIEESHESDSTNVASVDSHLAAG